MLGLVDLATLKKVTRTPTASGGTTDTEATVAAAVPCRVWALSTGEITQSFQLFGQVSHGVLFEPDRTDLEAWLTATVAARGSQPAFELEFVSGVVRYGYDEPRYAKVMATQKQAVDRA